MNAFLKWVRNRFTKNDLMHLVDIEDENLQLLMFQNGPSRDEFIKVLVYKLLDINPDSQTYDLENILVSFGLLDKKAAHNFLKGNMSTKLHTATWKLLIESLIPTTTINTPSLDYEQLMDDIFEKSHYLRSVVNKNYLPPELISKLKVQTVLDENSESIDEISEQIIKILKKPIIPDGNNEFNAFSSYEEQITDCKSSEFMDFISIKKEIDQCNKISNDTKITQLNNERSIKMNPQEFLDLIEKQNLIHTHNLESKLEDIHKLVTVEQDLQTLANSLTVQL